MAAEDFGGQISSAESREIPRVPPPPSIDVIPPEAAE